jgi:hypothetical protein
MTDIAKIKGKHIRRILQTPWSEPIILLEGLPDAYYCSIYIELDDLSALQLSDDIISFKDTLPDELIEINPSEHDVDTSIDYKKWKIKTIAKNQLEEKYLILDSDGALFYQTGFGTHLSIKKLSEIMNVEIDTGVKEILKDLETDMVITI